MAQMRQEIQVSIADMDERRRQRSRRHSETYSLQRCGESSGRNASEHCAGSHLPDFFT
jgi:hypothetical protein